MLIDKRTILKNTVYFEVTQGGQFYAYIKNKDDSESRLTEYCDTLKKAQRQARLELKKEQVRVAVPFTYLSGPRSEKPRLLPAIAKGRHARDRYRILIWVDDGTENGLNDTLTSYYSTTVLKSNIPARDIARVKRLFDLRLKLQKGLEKVNLRIREWEAEHSFNLTAAVDAAIAEATPKPTPKSEQPPS